MAVISFYHLSVRPLEWALPKLLERTLAAGERAVVMVGSEDRVAALDALLWTYDPASWLPHGSARGGRAADQPVWLTASDENPNGAGFLFLADGAASDRLDRYRRVFDLFDGSDPAAVGAARDRWRACKAAGHELTYWQQDRDGRWRKAA